MSSSSLKFLILLSFVLIVPSSWAQQARVHQYKVSIGAELLDARVKVCFEGEAPEYLIVDYRKATKNLIKLPKTNDGFIEFEGRYWKTKGLAKNACLSYHVDISDHNKNRRYNVKGPALSYFSENSWLWLPEKLRDDEAVEIQFDLPKQYRVSAPWNMLDQKGHHYRIGRASHDWGFTIVIGEFDLKSIVMKAGRQINLAVLHKVKQKDKLSDWVKNTGESLENYLGYFPVEQLQVLMIQSRKSRRSPVPWGEVKRGGGFGVILVVDSSRDIESFYQDWTITHEFSHLLVPNIQYNDIWLSEGLASYLQYVLMAQSKQLTAEQTWQKLYDGFGRGLKGTLNSSKEPLADTVKNRRRGGAGGRTKRIYWSGAAYFFLADIQLREQTQGKMHLPKLLAKLNKCCLETNKEWSGKELSEKLDTLSETKIFSQLYQEIAYSVNFPDYEVAYKNLGMTSKSGRVSFDKNKDNDSLRNSLLYGESILELADKKK